MTTLIITLITVASLTSWVVVKIMNKREKKRIEEFSVYVHHNYHRIKELRMELKDVYAEFLKEKNNGN
jgi:hypothetical protein